MTTGATIPISRNSWWTLIITAAAGFMVSLEITVISLAFTDIQESFEGTSRATLSWIFTAYNIGIAALLLLAGWAADRYGRKRLFLTGMFVFVLGSLFSGLSVDAPTLIAARVVQSVGGAMQFPAALALLLPAFPLERRGMAIGIWGASGALAAALGPSVGAALINAFGWRSIFLVNLPVGMIAIGLGALILVESRADDLQEGVDRLSVPMASVGVGLMVLAIAQTETWGIVSVPTGLCVLGAVVLLWGFVRRSRQHPAPLFDLDLLKIRSFSVSLIGTVFFCAAFFGWFRLIGSQPRSPASSSVGDGDDSPATPIGGCGCCSGARCWTRSISGMPTGTLEVQNLPSCFQPGSSVHIFRIMSMASAVISRFSPPMPSTPNISRRSAAPMRRCRS